MQEDETRDEAQEDSDRETGLDWDRWVTGRMGRGRDRWGEY